MTLEIDIIASSETLRSHELPSFSKANTSWNIHNNKRKRIDRWHNQNPHLDASQISLNLIDPVNGKIFRGICFFN